MAKKLASRKRAPAKRGNGSPKQTAPSKWRPGKFAVWSRRCSDPGKSFAHHAYAAASECALYGGREGSRRRDIAVGGAGLFAVRYLA